MMVDTDGITPEPLLDNVPLDSSSVSQDDYQAGFGEPLTRTLDLETWPTGEDLAIVYERIASEVENAIAHENRARAANRARVFPQLGA